MKIYRVTDKIPVKINSLEFKISPLSYLQKQEVQAEIMKAEMGQPMALMNAARIAVKYSVKEVSGIEDMDGNAYELEFDDSGVLSDNCVDDLLNCDQDQKLQVLCASLVQGVPQKLIGQDGKPIEGVVIGGGNAQRKKK